MTRRPSHRIGVLCLLGTIAIAGCAAHGHAAGVPTGSAVASAPLATASPSADAAVDQQLNTIDEQINTIDGQLNAANAGLNSSEGDPAK